MWQALADRLVVALLMLSPVIWIYHPQIKQWWRVRSAQRITRRNLKRREITRLEALRLIIANGNDGHSHRQPYRVVARGSVTAGASRHRRIPQRLDSDFGG